MSVKITHFYLFIADIQATDSAPSRPTLTKPRRSIALGTYIKLGATGAVLSTLRPVNTHAVLLWDSTENHIYKHHLPTQLHEYKPKPPPEQLVS